jgi:cytochrome c biogenesis protein CcmG, thiol:disulfide interchange protein DsbE
VPGRPGLASADFANGQPRLLNVFASWCVPCIAEAPRLAELAERGVIIDGIAIRDRREDLEAFLARHGNPYRAIGADDRSEVQIALGSAGVPETFVIDGQGTVTYQHIGEIRPEHIPLLLEKLEAAGG